jgi:hypothetical protein
MSETNNNIYHTESFWTSAEQDKILAALLKFHKADIKIIKDRTVPVGGGKTRSYTTLDEILFKIKPVLNDYGLLIHQHLAGAELVTMIQHESGQFIANKVQFVSMNGNNTNNLQNAGGGLTYLKRYQISALLQINSDEDDDGATANETVVTSKLPDSKLPELKAFLANGGSLDQVKQKYFLTPSQLKQLTEL